MILAGFKIPSTLRLPPSEWPEQEKPAIVHATKEELFKLATTWDDHDALLLIPADEVCELERCGLFPLCKDEGYDRLIINPTVIIVGLGPCPTTLRA